MRWETEENVSAQWDPPPIFESCYLNFHSRPTVEKCADSTMSVYLPSTTTFDIIYSLLRLTRPNSYLGAPGYGGDLSRWPSYQLDCLLSVLTNFEKINSHLNRKLLFNVSESHCRPLRCEALDAAEVLLQANRVF